MTEYAWVGLALTSAFMLATSDALTKLALERSNEYLVAWFRLFFSLPPLLVSLFFVPFPALDAVFARAVLISVPVEIVTIVLYVRALKVSPMSLSLPFLALTPVFLVSVSFLVLGERVSLQGACGILFIAAGGYSLNIGDIRHGILAPFRAVLREKGPLLMIGVALLYSVTASMGKLAITHSSAVFFGAFYFVLLTVCFAPIAYFRGRHELAEMISSGRYRRTVLPGLCYGLMVITHMVAMSMTKVAYMVSVKRTSLLMGVLYGFFMFREGNMRSRFAGALLMFCGFVLVVTTR